MQENQRLQASSLQPESKVGIYIVFWPMLKNFLISSAAPVPALPAIRCAIGPLDAKIISAHRVVIKDPVIRVI